MVHLPVFGLAVVMGDEKTSFAEVGVIATLRVRCLVDGYVIRFAFNDNEWIILALLLTNGAPDYYVSAGIGGPTGAGWRHLFFHLFDGIFIFVDKRADILLSDPFFRCFNEPFLADVAPDFTVDFTPDLK